MVIVLIAVIFLLVKEVKRYLPNAREENFRAVADFCYATRQVATFFTCLQGFVNIDDLLITLAEVAGPHLIFDVFVPHARVYYCFTLHAARDLVQDVALACIFS